MNILLKNIVVIDSNSSFNGKKKDIGIVKGKITFDIDNNRFSKEYDLNGASICPGLMDMRAFMGEPGLEHKEDFESFQNAAKRGGFTSVAILPNTDPILENKNILQSVIKRSEDHCVNLYPIAALSKGTKGEELSEMIDLHKHGAIAFSDGHRPVFQSDLIMKGLQYSLPLDSVIINTPIDYNLSKKGYVNEGETSTSLGMPGIPHIAEEVAIERDLKLLEYTGGKLHFSLITTERGVDLIRKAKKNGLNVTCDVGAHYLAFDDSCLNDFDSNYKVFPPFRLKKDIKALKKGLKDGTIDVIVSDHRPENIENKKLEFDRAEFGISSIETTFGTICTYSNLTELEILDKLVSKPREILGLEVPSIEEGEKATISIIDFESDVNIKVVSKSKNNPFINTSLKGKIIGVVNGTNSWIDNE